MSALTGEPSPSVMEEPGKEELAVESPPTMEALDRTPDKEEPPDEVPWAPRMDAIRKAQLAEVNALEEVVGALASRQQSSITKLRKQMDTIIAWKSQTTAKERRVAARGEAANAANRAKVAAEPGNTADGTDTNAAKTGKLEGSGGRSDAEPSALVVDDSEEWDVMLEEEPVEQGRVGMLCVCKYVFWELYLCLGLRLLCFWHQTFACSGYRLGQPVSRNSCRRGKGAFGVNPGIQLPHVGHSGIFVPPKCPSKAAQKQIYGRKKNTPY